MMASRNGSSGSGLLVGLSEAQLTGAARRALYGSVAIAALLSILLWLLLQFVVDIETDDTDYASLIEVQDLQGLVQIDTTLDRGDEQVAARYIAGLLEREGIVAEIESFPKGKANLIATLPGRTDETLILHGHLDTDPILQPERWRHEPFGAELDGPHIYGRGAYDMKSVTVAQVHAMLSAAQRAREAGPALRTLVLLVTSSEETTSELGTKRILEQRPELIRRAWGVLGEGGVVEAPSWERIKYWGTSFMQKQFAPFEYRFASREAAQKAFDELRWGAASSRWPDQGAPTRNPWAEEFLATYGATRDHPDLRSLMSEPESLTDDEERFAQLPSYLQALFRNERHLFPPQPGPNGGWRVRGTLHLRPGGGIEEAMAEVLPPAEVVPEGQLRLGRPEGARGGSSTSHPVFVGLQDAIAARHGDVPRGGYFLAYFANDCRYFRQADVACYGFSPFVLPGTDSATIAGPDERIALRGYVEGVDLYREVVQGLLDGP